MRVPCLAPPRQGSSSFADKCCQKCAHLPIHRLARACMRITASLQATPASPAAAPAPPVVSTPSPAPAEATGTPAATATGTPACAPTHNSMLRPCLQGLLDPSLPCYPQFNAAHPFELIHRPSCISANPLMLVSSNVFWLTLACLLIGALGHQIELKRAQFGNFFSATP